MTVTANTSFVQIPGNGSATVFAAPMKCFQAADVVVNFVASGVAALQASGYAVSNIDTNGGFTVTFAAAPPLGVLVDIRTRTPLTQTTEFANLGQYLPENTTECVDRLTRCLQDVYRQAYTFGIHGPDSEGTAWPALPAAPVRAGAVLSFDANGLPTLGVPSYQLITTALLAGFLGTSQTPAEAVAGVVPYNQLYAPLDPRRYGMMLDGISDDTYAGNLWVSVINASTNPVSTWPSGGIMYCQPLNPITANNFTWNMQSIIKVVPNSWGTGPTMHVQVNGTGARIYGLSIDGNQSLWSSAIAGYLLSMGGNDFILDSVKIRNSCSEGLVVDTINKFQVTKCHFDSNAYAGVDLRACSNYHFSDCTINFNGYGFQKTLATNAFQAFGVVQRFRCHDATWDTCDARQNGRDGLNTNQGSYGITYTACNALGNGDGGFTITCDQTYTGRLGEAESCYDLQYIGCRSGGNWSSGLAAYSQYFPATTTFVPACYNVTVSGGMYYNNHQQAGLYGEQTSFFSGLYFGGGCLGITVDTKAYDDRQLCGITNTPGAGGVIAATGWVAGTMGCYPRVAIYNAGLVFQGYGNITAEASGSVTITSSVSNGITVANIVPGWYVSQRVQHTGCLFDNNVQGTQKIDGWGFLQGVLVGLTPYKMYSGSTANGQNVRLPDAPLDVIELISNPTFDSNVTGWTVANSGGGSGATFSYVTASNLVRSAGAGQLYGGTAGAVCDGTLITPVASFAQNCFVELSIWVDATNPGDAAITLYWNSTAYFTSVQHPGGGWQRLVIGAFISAGYGALGVRLIAAAGKSPSFDNAYLRVKAQTIDSRDTYWPTRNLPI